MTVSPAQPEAGLGPLLLDPVLVSKPWGGRRLEQLGRVLPPDEQIGESWDVADLDPATTTQPDPVSRVASGPHAGASLGDLIDRYGAALLGSTEPTAAGRLPLLVKVIDAREHLSVQVHPPHAYVERHPEALLKTESWVVLDADPGAELMIGVRPGTTLEDVEAALGTPAVADLLRRVPAGVGDVHHLPAGLIHALGAGVVVAEVQTPSDTTFRIYDWSAETGREPREMALEPALACLELAWDVNVDPPGVQTDLEAGPVLVDLPEYRLLRRVVEDGGALVTTPGAFRVLLVVQGRVAVDGLDEPLTRGEVVVLPAAFEGAVDAAAGSTVLEMVP